MSIHHHELRTAKGDEVKAVAVLAKIFHDAVPKGTPEAVVFSAGLAFICACAEVLERPEPVARLMHAAADELLKGGTGFGATSH